MSSKRVNLELHQKLTLIKLSSQKSQRALANEFKISVGAVNNILKRKHEFMSLGEENFNPNAKRRKKSTNEDVNKLTWQWFVSARSKNMVITGPLLQAKALEIAKELDIETFKASNGWLEKFRELHNIHFKKLSGESGCVDSETVSAWKEQLHMLIEDYNMDDIYNADETGMFYKAIPTKSLVMRDESCKGTKVSKDRLTCLLSSNWSGTDKLKPLVIGKSQKPRCFRNVKDFNKLPVTWRANKKAWMNTFLFDEWLTELNKDMKRKGRKILMFLDNAPSHPKKEFSNIEVKFFPANCTSELQPMDQGIIQSMKIGYRKRLLKKVLSQVDTCSSGDEVVKSINVQDAIDWISQAWAEVRPDTIRKCYAKAGFVSFDGFEPDSEQAEINSESSELEQLISDVSEPLGLERTSVDAFINCDKDDPGVHACDGENWESDILDSSVNQRDTEGEEDSASDSTVPPMPTTQEVLKCLETLKAFTGSHAEAFHLVMKTEAAVQDIVIEKRNAQRQTNIMDFFTVTDESH